MSERTMEMTATMEKAPDEGGDKTAEAQRQKRLRAKNLTLLAALLAFVVLVYFVSIVRMGGG